MKKELKYIDEYDKIWDNLLLPLILEYSKTYKLKYKPIFYIRRMIWHFYNNQRDLLLKKYMSSSVTDIDRHKIASCFVNSILEVKPLYIPLSAEMKLIFTNKKICQILGACDSDAECQKIGNKIYYANEYLALSVAMSLINGYINADPTKTMKHKIVIPEPFENNTPDYILDVCINLHFCGKRKMDVATLSNIFFLWEKYSCRRMQCENLEEELLSMYALKKSWPDLSDEEKTQLKKNNNVYLKKVTDVRLNSRNNI